MVEEWKPILEYEGLYEISNHGRVKSCFKCYEHNNYCFSERIMKLQLNHQKYHTVHLTKPGAKNKKFFVHRLVAFHFLENIDDGRDFVNHKDKSRINNHVSNLEFMTHQENCDHRDGKCSDEPF